MIQLYNKGMPVNAIRRWFEENKGLKIYLSTLWSWVSGYKRKGFFPLYFRNLHNPSTVQNGTQGEYLSNGAQVENLDNWPIVEFLRNGGQSEDVANVTQGEDLTNGAQVEELINVSSDTETE